MSATRSSASSAANNNPRPSPPATTSHSQHQPAQHSAQPQAIHVNQPQQGILSQIATTAAGVAVGHTVGRMVTGLFSGGNSPSEAPGEASTNQPALANNHGSAYSNEQASVRCEADNKRFMDCMAAHHDDLNACYTYYEMLKACRAQASAHF